MLHCRPPLLSSTHLLLHSGLGSRPVFPALGRGVPGGRGTTTTMSSFNSTVRKTLSSYCSWKCTAITFMLLSVALVIALAYFMGKLTSDQ